MLKKKKIQYYFPLIPKEIHCFGYTILSHSFFLLTVKKCYITTLWSPRVLIRYPLCSNYFSPKNSVPSLFQVLSRLFSLFLVIKRLSMMFLGVNFLGIIIVSLKKIALFLFLMKKWILGRNWLFLQRNLFCNHVCTIFFFFFIPPVSFPLATICLFSVYDYFCYICSFVFQITHISEYI